MTIRKSFVLVLLLLLAGSATAHNSPAEAAPSPKEKPSFHYFFAHRYLPSLLHTEPQAALGMALLDTRMDLLTGMWDHCRKAHPDLTVGVDRAGLAIHGGELSNNIAIAVITMPPPKKSPEAYYMCVLVTYSVDENGKAHGQDVTYYTLEKGVSLEKLPGANKEDTEPTVIGGWTKDNTHRNYGAGPKPGSAEEFAKSVMKFYLAKPQ